MRHNQPTTNKKEAQDAISLDFKLKELIGPGQMFKLTLIQIFPVSPIRTNRAANFCWAAPESCSSHSSAGMVPCGAT
jgi:chromatin remodeling complex protein RSC6